MTDSPTHCPDCGTALPADSPQQLCPSCLLKQAFASRTVAGEPAKALTPPPSPEDIADKFPQFEITECLGRGGMGVVYKARQKSLHRDVAIKILAPEKVGEEHFAERFAREARTLAQLNHPNIVTVYDHGETDGLFYIVMEYVDGVNLRDLLREGKIESAQALAIVPPVCEALQYAHDKGIVHRDIKPENLLLDRDGRVKIADFGIASLVGAVDEQSGTPPYMAPEQGSHTDVDHRADIYALGVVLYEMLTGERPASPLELPSSRMRGIQLDVRIDDIVLRALSEEPERRYRTANEFRTVVETVAEGSTMPATASTPTLSAAPAAAPRAKRGMFRRFWWVLLIMIPVGTALGLLGVIALSYATPKEYESAAVIQARPSQDEIHSPSGRFHEKHLENLVSTDLLTKVSQELDLPMQWNLSEQEVVSRLEQIVSVKAIPGTDLFEIRVRSTYPQGAPDIANTLATLYAAEQLENLPLETPPAFQSLEEQKTWERAAKIRSQTTTGPVTMHEMARPASRPAATSWRKSLLIGGTASFFLSPLLGLLLMALLHRIYPDRGGQALAPPPEEEAKGAFYAKLSLALFLTSILGTLAMMVLSPRHDLALLFGAAALLLAFIFGFMGRGSRIVKALAIFLAILFAICSFLFVLIFVYRSLAFDGAKIEAEGAREQAVLEKARTRAKEETQAKEFAQVAFDFMEAVKNKDLKAAQALCFSHTNLSEKPRTQWLRDFEEINEAYDTNPTLLTTFSEWYRTGGYALGRVTPPAGGDGRSLYLMLGHSPQGWQIIEINDLRPNESLADKFEEYRESN